MTKDCGVNCCAPDWKEPRKCSPDIIDPSQAQTITVTLKSEHARLLGDLTGVAMEHVTGTPIVVAANSFKVVVPSGAVRIIGVEHLHHA